MISWRVGSLPWASRPWAWAAATTCSSGPSVSHPHGQRTTRSMAPPRSGGRAPPILAFSPDEPIGAAVTGPGGWLEGAAPGHTVIETSTIEPAAIVALAERVGERGARVLDVALSGEPPQAAAGELVFQVGGDDDLVAEHAALLEAMSKKINRTGGVGTAKIVKLVNNLMSIGNIAVASEAFVLGVKCGMDPERLFEILSVSGGRSAHFNHDFPGVLAGDYTPGFKTSLALKDMRLILDLAAAEGYPARLAQVVEHLYAESLDAGRGDEHFTSVVKLYEQAAATTING